MNKRLSQDSRSVKISIAAVFAVLALFSGGLTTTRGGQHGVEEKPDWSVFLPEGEGRAEVLVSCSGCHDLRQVVTQKKTSSNWSQTVQKMISTHDAPVDPQDTPILVAYLADHFGEKNPIDQLPLDINSASTEALARLPGVNAEMARAIVEARQSQQRFASVGELARLKCIDKVTLEKIKPYVIAKK
jgi:competence ComEA-like helix-hairpin-helix protein